MAGKTASKPKTQTKRQVVTAAARRHGVPPWLLWGIFGAESTWGTNGSNYFGLIEGSYPQLNGGKGRSVKSTTNVAEDADVAAELLASLAKEHGGFAGAVLAYSGGEYSIAHPKELSKSNEHGSEKVNVDFGLKDLLPGGLGDSIAEELGLPSIPSPLGPLSEAGENIIGGGSGGISGILNSINDFGTVVKRIGELIFTPAGWLRIAKMVGGAVMILWGIKIMIRESTGTDVVKSGTKTVGKIADVAALAAAA